MNKAVPKCPKCKHEIKLSPFFMKRVIHCKSCNEKIYIDTKMWFYIVLFIIFMGPCYLFMTYMQTTFTSVPQIIMLIILIVFLYVCISIVQFIVIKLFGFYSIFNLHNDDYYKQDSLERSNRDKEQRK